MEVVAHDPGPQTDFLRERAQARDRASGIVLIFDECTSGFRQTFGGLHKLYGVEPDMAMFGKALGNGYAITATIGRARSHGGGADHVHQQHLLDRAHRSDGGTEDARGMERVRSWEQITRIGTAIGERWQALARKYELPLELNGLPALIGFSFKLNDMLKYKTLITQEMLKKGYLAATAVYVCTEHTQPIVDRYFEALDLAVRADQGMRGTAGPSMRCSKGRSVTAASSG